MKKNYNVLMLILGSTSPIIAKIPCQPPSIPLMKDKPNIPALFWQVCNQQNTPQINKSLEGPITPQFRSETPPNSSPKTRKPAPRPYRAPSVQADLCLQELKEAICQNPTSDQTRALKTIEKGLKYLESKNVTTAQFMEVYNQIDELVGSLSITYPQDKVMVRTDKSDDDCFQEFCPSIIQLLLELKKDIRECHLELEALIENSAPCNAPIPINAVPAIINAPGKYCVTSDLFYLGDGAALTIAANNVFVDFDNHLLTLTSPLAASYGILINNVNNVTISSCVINTVAIVGTNVGIDIFNAQNVSLEQCNVVGTFNNVSIENSANVMLSKCNLRDTPFCNIALKATTNFTMDNCTVHNNAGVPVSDRSFMDGVGLIFNGYQTATISNCLFFNAPLYAQYGTNLTIFQLNSLIGDSRYTEAAVKLGSSFPSPDTPFDAQFTTIINTVLTNTAAIRFGLTLHLANGNNIVCDNCVFDLDAALCFFATSVWIGQYFINGPEGKWSNAIFNNCSISSNSCEALTIANPAPLHDIINFNQISFNNCIYNSGPQKGLSLSGAVNCLFNSCAFDLTYFTIESSNNMLQNSFCHFHPMLNIAPGFFSLSSSKNVIRNNFITPGPIVDQGTANVVVGNTYLP